MSAANLDIVLTAVESGCPDVGTSSLGKGKDRDDEPVRQGVENLVVRGSAVGQERPSERAESLDIELALVGLHRPHAGCQRQFILEEARLAEKHSGDPDDGVQSTTSPTREYWLIRAPLRSPG